MPRRAEFIELAEEILVERFPDAACGFAAGSVMRGEGTKYSDLDFVVLYDEGFDDVHRESFMFRGVPIEAFVQNEASLDYFMEADRKSGRPAMPNMIAEGVVVGNNEALAAMQKDKARKILDAGAAKLTKAEIDRRRYVITDLCDDLREPRSREEAQMTLAVLYPKLIDFFLRAHGEWSGSGKGLIRALNAVDDSKAKEFAETYQKCFETSQRPMIKLAERVLMPYGGFLWDGFREKAEI